ncbi:MAG: endonuclease domain-containing protein [Actinomycetota bacterium]|nr:endonuclease domain-containing protein [Actinomycetota bacterium]
MTRAQALGAGLSDGVVDGRVRAERWERMARDVYRVPGSTPSWRQSLLAAILTAGAGAVASHQSAAALWGLPGFCAGPVEVTRLRGPSRVARVGTLHETRCLPASQVAAVDGIPVTSSGRTLLDLCGAVHPKRAERALANALAMKLTTSARLHVVLAEAGKKGRPGSQLLRRLLEDGDDGQAPPESELENLLAAVLKGARLPTPSRQVELGNDTAPIGRVDFAYREARLVLEADSRRHHSSWLDAEADRRRNAALMAGGWYVLRVSWDQLVNRPAEVVAAVGGVLERAK